MPQPPVPTPIQVLTTIPGPSGDELYAAIGPQVAKLGPSGWLLLGGSLGWPRTALAGFTTAAGTTVCAGGFPGRVLTWDGAAWQLAGAPVTGTVEVVAGIDDGSGPALYAGGSSFGSTGDLAGWVAKKAGGSVDQARRGNVLARRVGRGPGARGLR